MTTRIALLFPNFRLYEPFSGYPHQPSLSLGYLAGTLEKHQIPYIVIDAAAENLTMEKLLIRLRKFNPNYVGITTNIALSYAAVTTSLVIQRNLPNVKVIMGGPWATAEAVTLIKRHYANIVVLGEGELTLVELAKIDLWDVDALKAVKGICFKNGSEIITTEPRPLIENLDDLPFPRWECFPKKIMNRNHRKKFMVPLITSRGCPFDCINYTKIIHGKKMRFRSIENIMKELDYLKTIGVQEIAIEDDVFNIDISRSKTLLREIISKKYGFSFQLTNGIRADKVDLEFAHLLYSAGAYRVALGIESGSQKIVDFLGKRLKLNVLPKTVSILHKAHLKVVGYFILGLPLERLQTLIQTIDFADRIDLDIIALFTLIIFPGTRLYEYLLTNTNFQPQDLALKVDFNYQFAPMQFDTHYLTPHVIRKAKVYHFIRAFLKPRRMYKFVVSYTFMEFLNQLTYNMKVFVKRILMTTSRSKKPPV